MDVDRTIMNTQHSPIIDEHRSSSMSDAAANGSELSKYMRASFNMFAWYSSKSTAINQLFILIWYHWLVSHADQWTKLNMRDEKNSFIGDLVLRRTFRGTLRLLHVIDYSSSRNIHFSSSHQRVGPFDWVPFSGERNERLARASIRFHPSGVARRNRIIPDRFEMQKRGHKSRLSFTLTVENRVDPRDSFHWSHFSVTESVEHVHSSSSTKVPMHMWWSRMC